MLALDPGQVLRALSFYTLAAIVVAFLTLLLVIWLVVRANILTRRHEEARSTARPLWYRQHLDLAIAVLAVAGYLLILYLQHGNNFSVRRGRFWFPRRWNCWRRCCSCWLGFSFSCASSHCCCACWYIWSGTRAVLPVGLALVQMERAPRQPMRMALLLGLTTAFVFFSLVFSASQGQRAQDLATYQAVSDLSGYTASLPVTPPENAASVLSQADASYRKIQGVTSVTIGYVDDRYLLVNSGTSQIYTHKTILTAVDARPLRNGLLEFAGCQPIVGGSHEDA